MVRWLKVFGKNWSWPTLPESVFKKWRKAEITQYSVTATPTCSVWWLHWWKGPAKNKYGALVEWWLEWENGKYSGGKSVATALLKVTRTWTRHSKVRSLGYGTSASTLASSWHDPAHTHRYPRIDNTATTSTPVPCLPAFHPHCDASAQYLLRLVHKHI
jgi:hypothetical protein